MSKFTDGEWLMQITQDGAIVLCGNADPISGKGIIFMNEAVHDAHLISAAPDMYRALRDLLDVIDWPSDYPERIKAAEKALAKADGEQQ